MPDTHRGEKGFERLGNLIQEMFAVNPQKRPDPLEKVAGINSNVLGNI